MAARFEWHGDGSVGRIYFFLSDIWEEDMIRSGCEAVSAMLWSPHRNCESRLGAL